MKKNMGGTDRVIRIIVALVIAGLYGINAISGAFGVVLLVLAAIVGLTSVVNFCPVYAILGVSTCSTEEEKNKHPYLMDNDKKAAITAIALRLLLGWFMFFDGVINLLNSNFTASKFLLGAKTFPNFYAWFAAPGNIWWVDPVNVWGIILIGVALLLGVFIRPAAWAGVVMMIVYYFPHYNFPIVPNGYIVETHIIYGAIFVFIVFSTQAQQFALGNVLRKTCLGKIPYVGKLL